MSFIPYAPAPRYWILEQLPEHFPSAPSWFGRTTISDVGTTTFIGSLDVQNPSGGFVCYTYVFAKRLDSSLRGRMAKQCEVCGKKPVVGRTLSHANNVSARRFEPNLQ